MTISLALTFALLALAPESQPAAPQKAEPLASGEVLESVFRGYHASFRLIDPSGARAGVVLDARQAEVPVSPWSTFKICNALVALETGVASGPDFPIPWDKQTRSRPEWNQDQTLRTAMERSTVWYFQELARRIGPKAMQKYLSAARYGNADISGGIDQFWLGKSLRISLDEQIAFLLKLQKGQDLPFRRRNQEIVRDLIRLKVTEKGTLRGKTGTGDQSPGLGWFVGWVEHDGKPYFFATQLTGDGVTGVKARELTEEILVKAGLL